ALPNEASASEPAPVSDPSTAASEPANAAVSPPPPPPVQVPVQPAARVAPKPFVSIEDLVALQIASEPQVSPDGLLITYSVLKSDAEANTARSSIWLVPAVTGASGKLQPQRQLTAEALNSAMPRW